MFFANSELEVGRQARTMVKGLQTMHQQHIADREPDFIHHLDHVFQTADLHERFSIESRDGGAASQLLFLDVIWCGFLQYLK